MYGGTTATPSEWVADSVVMIDEHGRIDLVGPWDLPAEAQGPALEGLDMATDADIRSALLGGLAPGTVLDCRGLYVLPGLVAVAIGGDDVPAWDPQKAETGVTACFHVASPKREDVAVIRLPPGRDGAAEAAEAAWRWWQKGRDAGLLGAFVGGCQAWLLEAVRQAADRGVPSIAAINMASLGPAAVAGVARGRGALLRGYRADVVIVDEEWHVVATLIGGQVVYSERSLAVPEPDIAELEWPDA